MNLAAAVAMLAAASALGQPGVVRLRGGETPLTGIIRAMEPAGLSIDTETGRRVVGWDWVRAVEGVAAPEPLAALALRAWRARTRSERGDCTLAEPDLESLAGNLPLAPGPTQAAVFRSLLLCRLGRAAYTQATPVMLDYAASLGGDRATWFTPTLPAREVREEEVSSGMAWDDTLGLCPLLPPVWADIPAAQALARQPWPELPGRAGVLRGLYLASLRRELGQAVRVGPDTVADEGVRLVTLMATATCGSDAERESARAALDDWAARDVPAWARAWCHAAVGRSLVGEPDRERRLLGVAELLRVPAEDARLNPNLTALCMAHAAVTLAELDRPEAARSLASELGAMFPSHPVLGWDAIVRLRVSAPRPVSASQGGSH